MDRRDFIASVAVSPVAAAAAARGDLVRRSTTGRPPAQHHAARHRHAGAVAEAPELRLSDRGRQRPDRVGSRSRRASPPDRKRSSHHRRDARVLHAPALRPLHGLWAAGPAAMGSGRRSDSRSAGLWPAADRADDRTAVWRGRHLRARHPRPHEHRSSLDVFEARGGKAAAEAARRRKSPRFTPAR